MDRDSNRAQDILNCIDHIQEYTSSLEFKDFVEHKMVQDAVMRNFTIIGEAAKKISEEFKRNHSKIPWKKIAGMRDNVVHDYLDIDLELVWKTI